MINLSGHHLVILINCYFGMLNLVTPTFNFSQGREMWSPRIVNGHRCPIKDHPYMASIRVTKTFKHNCGGTILSEYWVLTAGHCCDDQYKRGTYTVVTGLSIITNTTGPEHRNLVIRNYIHTQKQENDICLMELENPLAQSKSVRYVQLANVLHIGVKLEQACEISIAAGWGSQYTKDVEGFPVGPVAPYDPHLQCVELSVYNKKKCNKKYGFDLPDSIMCAYANGKDACQGDSGGPLMCNDVQYGISSFGVGCAFGGYPGAFTRVDKYEDFIRDIVLSRYKSGALSHLYIDQYFLLALLCTSLVMLKIK